MNLLICFNFVEFSGLFVMCGFEGNHSWPMQVWILRELLLKSKRIKLHLLSRRFLDNSIVFVLHASVLYGLILVYSCCCCSMNGTISYLILVVSSALYFCNLQNWCFSEI